LGGRSLIMMRIFGDTSVGKRGASQVFIGKSGEWLPIGTGANGSVNCQLEWNGDLYVGGDFTSIGGVTTTGIARWSGGSWYAVGGGIGTGYVVDICVYNNELYCLGTSSNLAGTGRNYFAKWNGTSWSGVGGSDLSDAAYALYVWDSKLLIGGQFFTAGGTSAFCIASWNGSSFADYSGGNGMIPITDFTDDGSTLYNVGGGYTSLVQEWSGSAWSSLGGDTGGSGGLFATQAYGGDLYVGGAEQYIDDGVSNVYVGCLGKLSSGSWSAVGALTTGLQELTTWNSNLIACGTFTNSGLNRIAQYDGTTLSAIGAGFNNVVYSVGKYGKFLVAVGDFTASGSTSIDRIAYWSRPEP